MNAVVDDGIIEVEGGWIYRGHKKGGGGSAPKESQDTVKSTSYARILLALSEGEIKGLKNGLQSIYLDGTPIQNANGSMNFDGVRVDFRTGTQYQDHIPGFPASEITENIGTQLKFSTPWVKALTETEWSAVRVTISTRSFQEYKDNGDIVGSRVDYAIDIATDGGEYVEMLRGTFRFRAPNGYARTHRIDLPKAEDGWLIRVRRLTIDSTSTKVANDTFIQDFSKVLDGKLRYPNTALLGIQVDASQFSNIPTIAADCEGLIIAVPSNYNAETRQYVGTWDGTFKRAYTNNPAWVFYDYLVSGRYGLLKNIDPAMIDKWALYRIGQYCDEMVPDGKGGQEPRFTCNAYDQVRADAYRVLTDIASIFRGIVYWGSGSAVAVADMPKDYTYTYNNANVIDGEFVYSGVPRKSKYNAVLVSWNDPSDGYRQKVESYVYTEALKRGGTLNQTEITAYGCTSRAQARRQARWTVLTSYLDGQTVTFGAGLDGAISAPGQIVRVADQHRAGRRISGRIRSATKSEIELDSDLQVRAGDRLTVNLPNRTSETREVLASEYLWLTADTTEYTADTTELTADMVGLPETVTSVKVSPPFSVTPEPEALWALESEELTAQTVRVLSVSEGDNNTYNITALKHSMDKFAAIDHESMLEDPPISVIPPKVQPMPENVRLENNSSVIQGMEQINATITWDAAEYAQEYEVEWRRDNSNWVTMARTPTLSVQIENTYAGNYEARVRAYNAIKSASLWANSPVTLLDGTLGEPPVVAYLQTTSIVYGCQVSWGFKEGLSIVERSELWYSTTSDRSTAVKLGEFAYPTDQYTHLQMNAGAKLYFWIRLIDRNGTEGAFYPEGAGVVGTASVDTDDYLGHVAGKIEESYLGKELQEKIDSGAGSATEIKQIQDDMAAMITLKAQVIDTDGTPVIAGVGVGVEEDPGGGLISQILLAANRVAVVQNPNGGERFVPFLVENGQVFMNSAMIKNLTAENLNVSILSEISENAGIIVAGTLMGSQTNSYIDLDAVGEELAVNLGDGAMTVTADGVLTINKADVIDTINIRGEAVSTTAAVVNANSTTVTGSPGSGISGSIYIDRSPLNINLRQGDAPVLKINLTGRIYQNVTPRGYTISSALQILRNGQVIRQAALLDSEQIEFDTDAGKTYNTYTDIQGYSLVYQDRVAADGVYQYSLRLRAWDTAGGTVTINVVDSSIVATVLRK